MDTLNIQPGDNLGSILPLSQTNPLKDDLEVIPKATPKNSVKLLRRLAILAAIVSTIGLVSNEISYYHFSSFYNFTSTFTSLASLIISSALIFWCTNTLNRPEYNTSDVPTRSWELFNQGLYTTLLFRAAITIPLIANMFFQGDNTSHNLRAIEATYQNGTYASTEYTLRNMAMLLPFFEVLLSLTFVQAARTIFPNIREQSNTMTRIVFIGSATLMASSFGMLYALRYASDYQDLHNQPFPSWNIGGLVFLGIVSSIVAGLVWTVNHTKWRGPFIIVAGVLAATTFGLALFSTLSYNNSQNIASLYGDMKDLQTWSEQMAATSKEDLRTIGCPSKYLPKSIANDPSFDAFWGPGATTKDGIPTKYLNIACVELLGNQQASYFAEATTYGLLAAVSGVIILIGFLYFNHIQWRDVAERSKNNFRWLVVLGAIALAFNVAMIMYEAPLPVFQSQAQLSRADNLMVLAVTTFRDPSEMSEDTMMNSRFMISKYDPQGLNGFSLLIGDSSATFSDFADAFDEGQEQIGMIDLSQIQGTTGEPDPYVVILAPGDNSASQILDDFGLWFLQPDPEHPLKYFVAKQKSEITIESLVANSKINDLASLYQFEEGQWEPPEPEELGGQFDEPSVLAVTTFKSLDELETGVDNIQTAKFTVYKLDPQGQNGFSLVVGDLSATFNDFVDTFNEGIEQIGMIDLRADRSGPIDPYIVVLAPGDMSGSQVFDDFGLEDLKPDSESELPIKYFVAKEKSEITPESLVANAKLNEIASLYQVEEGQSDQEDQEDQQGQSDQESSDESSGDDTTEITNVPEGEAVPEDVSAFQANTNNPYADIFRGLNAKRYRFVILKHDPNDPSASVTVSGGPWKMTFQDFLNTLEPYKVQVGFVYLGPSYSEKLYRVVFAPTALNANAGDVVDGFDLPRDAKGLAQLGLKGVSSYVAGSKSDLTEQKIITYSKATVS